MLLGDDHVLPHWLERQLDASGPAFVPGGGGSPPRNVAERGWTLVGALGAPQRATVDPRGLVTPAEDGWSLDWWVGSGERWHLPSREAAVRQSLLDGAPVVETILRVPNGEVVHRAFGVPGAAGRAAVVVEIENRSLHAVAVAVVVTPWSAVGPAPVERIAVDGATVEVDGRVGVVLDHVPAAVHLASTSNGGVRPLLGEPGAPPPAGLAATAPLVDDRRGAQAALVVPLPHEATLRAVVPLPVPTTRRSRGSRGAALDLPDPVPTASQVATGWSVHAGRGPGVRLPDKRLEALFEANRRHLLLVHAGEDLASVPTEPFDYADAATRLAALDALGLHDEAAEVLGTWEERQALDGRMVGDDGHVEANGAALVALARHWRSTGDDELPAQLVGPVASAARWIDKRRSARRPRRSAATLGMLPDVTGPDWLGAPGPLFRTDWWSRRGLLDAAAMLAAVGQPDAAEDARRSAHELGRAVADAMATAADTAGGVLPAGPGRGIDGGIIAIVDAVLLGALDVDAPLVTATLDAVEARYVVAGGVVQAVHAAGLSPRLTARLARAEVMAGDRRALDHLGWLVDHATSTAAWPQVVHPRTGRGVAGAGHDGVAAAELVLAVRQLLVREEPDGLVLSPIVPDTWLGQSWEVTDLPTEVGTFGFAVRWHGDRPALLWQLDARPGVGEVRLRAPGLDPAWSTTERSGEALLGPVLPVGDAAPGRDEPAEPDPPAAGADDDDDASGVTIEVPLPTIRRRGADSADEGPA